MSYMKQKLLTLRANANDFCFVLFFALFGSLFVLFCFAVVVVVDDILLDFVLCLVCPVFPVSLECPFDLL